MSDAVRAENWAHSFVNDEYTDMTDRSSDKKDTIVRIADTESKSGENTPSAATIFSEIRHSPDQIKELFRSGKYPYKNKIKRSAYDAHKEELQVELLKVQNWVKLTGQRIVVICEGRDAAGKGGTIKRFMEHLNPRAARVVALEKPTDA